ncbi:hypothetical protein CWR43_12185 [Rhizobium sullae]|uniref:Uncharacterized protein n=1 Tax=Rhizobium sullae TaxID=50338 RepID=A0A2N0DC64_RHISU|nr:hypothetical protein CWR43_12185 [Rhizobium sullae]
MDIPPLFPAITVTPVLTDRRAPNDLDNYGAGTYRERPAMIWPVLPMPCEPHYGQCVAVAIEVFSMFS